MHFFFLEYAGYLRIIALIEERSTTRIDTHTHLKFDYICALVKNTVTIKHTHTEH
jgi:hypothetical protein